MEKNKYLKYALFSLFHHDVYDQDKEMLFSSESLYNMEADPTISVKHISRTLFDIIAENIAGYSDNEVSLTLTGGMDSRVILACLLKAGIKPNCFTFGNPNTYDVVFAENIAKKMGLSFHNVCMQPPDKEWYYRWVSETIKRDKGHAHLHRAHRTAAIAEHNELYNPKILLTGHMGGEGIKWLSYNNYLASPFFEMVNEQKGKPLDVAKRVLHHYFIKPENIDYKHLLESFNSLSWMVNDKKSNKFFFLYNMVAKIHHAQDIRLYRSYVPKVLPVFLQDRYLETLFSSPYNILSRRNNLFSRLRNPMFYCEVLEEIYPPLMEFPFSNGFTPHEYMKGLWYYIPVKLYRDYTKKKKYPATFSYGQWYIDFIKEHARNISTDIWDIYDKKRYMQALENNEHQTDEGYWHKFSNPVFFDLINKLI